MPSEKIALLGGGSLFFRTVLAELAVAEELSGSEVVLYDIPASLERLSTMERFGKRVADQAGTGLKVRATTDLADAVDGAGFAVSSIGVSGPDRRWHELDVRTPMKYGIVQTTGDTVGPGGMMAGFRTIPIFLRIAREMERRCPDVIFLNHSNPMAVLCRTLTKYTGIRRVIGLCHGVQGTQRYLAEKLGVPYEELDMVAVGVNHMLWVIRLTHKGKDLYPLLREKLQGEEPPGHRFAKHLYEVFGYYPVNNDRHIIEFFPYLRSARTPEELPYGLRSRVESIEEWRREDAKQREWEELRRMADGEEPIPLPEELSPEAIGNLVADISLGRREVYIVNIPNCGCVPNLPDYAIVEVQGVTDDRGVRGLYTGEVPQPVLGWMYARTVWTELVVDAGVKGDRGLALQALAQDPQILSLHEAETLLDELLEAHRERLPQFFPK